MPAPVRERINANLGSAHAVPPVHAWRLLEDALVLSPPWPLPHVRVRAATLRSAWRTRDRGEVVGQLLRLSVAGPLP